MRFALGGRSGTGCRLLRCGLRCVGWLMRPPCAFLLPQPHAAPAAKCVERERRRTGRHTVPGIAPAHIREALYRRREASRPPRLDGGNDHGRQRNLRHGRRSSASRRRQLAAVLCDGGLERRRRRAGEGRNDVPSRRRHLPGGGGREEEGGARPPRPPRPARPAGASRGPRRNRGDGSREGVEATSVLDSSAAPFVNLTGTDVAIASKDAVAGSYVILAKTGMNFGTTRRARRLLAVRGHDEPRYVHRHPRQRRGIDRPDDHDDDVRYHPGGTRVHHDPVPQGGGAGTTFASQQQILTIKAGSASTTSVTF